MQSAIKKIIFFITFTVSLNALAKPLVNLDSFSWESGQIIITKHTWHPYSLFIQLGTKSNVEHVGMVFKESSGNFVYEFWGNKFRKTPVETFLRRVSKETGDRIVGIGKINGFDRLSDQDKESLRQHFEEAVDTQNFRKFFPTCTQFITEGLAKIGIRLRTKASQKNSSSKILTTLSRFLGLTLVDTNRFIKPIDFVSAQEFLVVEQFLPFKANEAEILEYWKRYGNWSLFERFSSASIRASIEEITTGESTSTQSAVPLSCKKIFLQNTH